MTYDTICRNSSKFNDLYSDKEESTFCVVRCQKYATKYEWVQGIECVPCGRIGSGNRERSSINCETNVPEKGGGVIFANYTTYPEFGVGCNKSTS